MVSTILCPTWCRSRGWDRCLQPPDRAEQRFAVRLPWDSQTERKQKQIAGQRGQGPSRCLLSVTSPGRRPAQETKKCNLAGGKPPEGHLCFPDLPGHTRWGQA